MPSLVLSWENPTWTYGYEAPAFRTQVHRTLPGERTVSQTIDSNSTWGEFEDIEHGDPSAHYTVSYHDIDGAKRGEVTNKEIRRWTRPQRTCRIDLCFVRPDSSPWAGRQAKLYDIPSESYIRDLYANTDGQLMGIVMWDWRMRLEVEGWDKALEFAVPQLRTAGLNDLIAHGTWVRKDPRFGL